MPKLTELLVHFARDLTQAEASANDLDFTNITADSRQVEAGSLFVAVRGVEQNGEDYIAQAISSGATAILTRDDAPIITNAAHLTTTNERHMLAKLADYFYPSNNTQKVAITGTNGKTSTAEFFRQLIELQGKKAASIGTMGLRSDSFKMFDVPALNTSPDPVLLHQTLLKLHNRKVDAVALEASSHGLDQHRMDGVQLQAAAFTNLTRDHLDYHKTERAYFEAKMRLFGQVLPRAAHAILNRDDSHYDELHKICTLRKHSIVSYGLHAEADFRIHQLTRTPHGLEIQLDLLGERIEIALPFIGDFQIMNLLAALGLAMACGHELHSLTHIMSQLKPIRGRMEQAAPRIYVDYAHTPDALEKALTSMRAHCSGKLHVVFGCGGDRDSGKRPQMGHIAAELADNVIVTDDNPRSEDAAEIRAQVAAGCQLNHHQTIANRETAIAKAIAALGEKDMLLIAGKGHETYQIIGSETFDFDDVEMVRKYAK